jgi:Family of unknown function (DUF5681)
MAFKPGQSGNPKGREKGIPDRRGKLRKLLEPHAEKLIDKAVEMALNGDPHALRLCLERLIPRAKDEPVDLYLPKDLTKGESLTVMGANILKILARKEITPEEAKTLLEVVALYRDNFIVQELCQNLNILAEHVNKPLT